MRVVASSANLKSCILTPAVQADNISENEHLRVIMSMANINIGKGEPAMYRGDIAMISR